MGGALIILSNPPLSVSTAKHSQPLGYDLHDPIAVYVHIPFCLSKCNYCDFNTYEGIEALMPSFADALRSEINLWGARLGHPNVSTIFFGGGTPSYLPAESIAQLLDGLRDSTNINQEAEITLEANPLTMSM